MYSKSNENGHPFLISKLWKKGLNISLLSIMSAIGFSVKFIFQIEGVPPLSYFSGNFLSFICVGSWQMLYPILIDIIM